MNRRTMPWLIVSLALVGVCVVARLAPHPANFEPVAAAALFAGFFFGKRRGAALVPLVVLVTSDAIIGMYDWRIMTVVYLSLMFPVVLGPLLQAASWRRIALGSLIGSGVFYLASNAAVWLFSPMYDHDLPGLVACYAAALPFFRFTLAGDLVWSGVIFGAYALATSGAMRSILARLPRAMSRKMSRNYVPVARDR